LGRYLENHGIPGIEGVDTRALVLHLRNRGAMRAAISTERHDVDELVKVANQTATMEGLNLVYDVTAPKVYSYKINERLKELKSAIALRNDHAPKNGNDPYKIVAYDYGVKGNILTL